MKMDPRCSLAQLIWRHVLQQLIRSVELQGTSERSGPVRFRVGTAHWHWHWLGHGPVFGLVIRLNVAQTSSSDVLLRRPPLSLGW